MEEYISALLSLRPIHDLTLHTTKILTEAVLQQDSCWLNPKACHPIK